MNENSNIAETKEDVKYNDKIYKNKIYKKTSKRKDNVLYFFKEKQISKGTYNNLESQKGGKQI